MEEGKELEEARERREIKQEYVFYLGIAGWVYLFVSFLDFNSERAADNKIAGQYLCMLEFSSFQLLSPLK
jgi:hypothetical protein